MMTDPLSSEPSGKVHFFKKLLAIVIGLLVLMVGAAFMGRQIWRSDRSLSKQLFYLDSKVELQALVLKDQQQLVQTHQEKIEFLVKTVEERLSDALKPQTAWTVREAAYFVALAQRRVTMEGDIEGAVFLLTTADQALARLGDPTVEGLRQLLIKHRQALVVLPKPDISGIVFGLQGLEDRVETWPFLMNPLMLSDRLKQEQALSFARINQVIQEEQARAGGSHGWERLLMGSQKMWRDILSMVQIRRHTEPLDTLYTAEMVTLVRLRIKTLLQLAMLAAERHQQYHFNAALDEVNRLLQRYFDTKSQEVMPVVQEIAALRNLSLKMPEYDFKPILEALRTAAVG
jgi:uroporphyrin-3 C-methyltransferase